MTTTLGIDDFKSSNGDLHASLGIGVCGIVNT